MYCHPGVLRIRMCSVPPAAAAHMGCRRTIRRRVHTARSQPADAPCAAATTVAPAPHHLSLELSQVPPRAGLVLPPHQLGTHMPPGNTYLDSVYSWAILPTPMYTYKVLQQFFSANKQFAQNGALVGVGPPQPNLQAHMPRPHVHTLHVTSSAWNPPWKLKPFCSKPTCRAEASCCVAASGRKGASSGPQGCTCALTHPSSCATCAKGAWYSSKLSAICHAPLAWRGSRLLTGARHGVCCTCAATQETWWTRVCVSSDGALCMYAQHGMRSRGKGGRHQVRLPHGQVNFTPAAVLTE
jgi:hypothetical protein